MRENKIIAGRYQLIRRIGQGGMGQVWSALCQDDLRTVAIKFLLPSLVTNQKHLTRFMREAIAATAAGRSEHVARVFDSGRLDDGVHFMVMEYVQGRTLREVLQREGRLEPARACDIIIQTCDGLAEAHGQGIVHRDIKPENIMLIRGENEREWVKILDFGIAKFRRSPDGATRSLTSKGAITGSPCYMAPERCNGSGILDHRSDIYALGIVLYELLTGRPPFVDRRLNRLLVRIIAEAPAPPRHLCPDLPPGLSSIVLKAIAKDLDQRFSAVDDLATYLGPFSWGRSGKDKSPLEMDVFDPSSEFWAMVMAEDEESSG